LLSRGIVRCKNAAQCAYLAKMQHESAGIYIPNYRNAATFKVFVCGFIGSPVRSKCGKFPHYERFNIRPAGFFVIGVCADVADMGIRQAHNLPGVARIGENFLVAGKASVENNFAATTGASARRATVKYASVLERESRASCEGLDQCVLQRVSFRCRVYR
jgi:hypothetical protein